MCWSKIFNFLFLGSFFSVFLFFYIRHDYRQWEEMRKIRDAIAKERHAYTKCIHNMLLGYEKQNKFKPVSERLTNKLIADINKKNDENIINASKKRKK